jgi:Uma2 family endonuclease
MAADPRQWVSPEEYLRQERLAETKSEYIYGMILAMSGATPNHVRITVNVSSELHQQLKDKPCEVFTTDLRVRVAEGGMYAYPDVVVVCGEPVFETEELDVLANPTVIIEVLSQSTESYDRGLKFNRYRRRASLQEYVLVAQDRISVERYAREGDHWVLTEANSLDDTLELSSIGCTLAVRDVYRKVNVPPSNVPPSEET